VARVIHSGTGYDTVDKFLNMTPSETAVALDNDFDKPHPPSGYQALHSFETQAHMQRWRSLTPRQRLDLIRQGKA